MYLLRDHISRHKFFHSFADVGEGNARRAVEGGDPGRAAVGERPGHRRHQVCAYNLAQMSLDFLEFDPVPEYLDLVVNSA
jgi:hypothetical protein